MKTKLYIISQNNVSINFWKLYINKKTTSIFKFRSLELLINSLKTNEPSVLVIDEYFTRENYPWIMTILNQVFKDNYQHKTYLLSPKFTELNSPYLINNSVRKYPFNSDFITALNHDLNITISLTA